MRHFLLLFFLPFLNQAQTATEIYVFDLSKSGEHFVLSNPQNITEKNEGYDNQPHFVDDNVLLLVMTKEGQTEVVQSNLKNGEKKQLSHTLVGSEYSPTPIPESKDFSAIRLDTTGLQLLYRYSSKDLEPKVILKDVVVGYHEWVNRDQLLAFVLGEPSTLQLCDVKTQKCKIVDSNIGRSLHKIPGNDENLMSYISKKNENWEVRSFDPETGETKKIINTLPGSEDLSWSPDGTIFMGKENKLYKYTPGKDDDWKEVTDLSKFGLEGITRLAINPVGNKIAVVVSE